MAFYHRFKTIQACQEHSDCECSVYVRHTHTHTHQYCVPEYSSLWHLNEQ